MEKERVIAGGLLGEVDSKGRAMDNSLTSEDLEKLTAPLNAENGESINVFCVGHHSVSPIIIEGRVALTVLADEEVPDSWDGKYFEVSSCPFCSEDGLYHDPVLKDYRM